MAGLDYWYQGEAVQAMLDCKDNGVVVLPTGSGKSHVLRGWVEQFEGSTLILSHVQEILEQNFSRLAGLDNIGLWSAGLNVKHLGKTTVAGIQSAFRKPDMFRYFDRVLIDEAHLVSNEGMYKTLLTELGVQYLGLTATDFRLKGGYIHGTEGMFDSICYQAPVDKLTEQGYLCPLVYRGDREPLDTEGIRTTGGDFNLKDMSLKFNRDAVSKGLAKKIAAYSDYKHILIFCIDIEHAENVARELTWLGMDTRAVHSKSPRDVAMRAFKAGELQALTNVNILTTGFDYPEIDMIVVLRPTKSMGLHQQMLGRGMRTHPSKTETLVKDFTKNTLTLGTVDYPAPLKEKSDKKGRGPNPFMKECPECFLICHPTCKTCECGYKFKFRHNLQLVAAEGRDRLPQWYQVDKVIYSIHHKVGSPNSLKVSYRCGLRTFNDYILLEHPGFASRKARHWLSRRFKGDVPTTVAELHRQAYKIKPAKRIQVEENSKYPRVLSVV